MDSFLKTVRTRMAPSPTGEFHIGGMRTLLYNYAFAKSHGGKLVLRIEDTDRERFVEGATERIYQVIKDYGLSWDEGPIVGGPHGPYIQSQRLELYKKYALELVEKGYAYYCFCTKERLEKLREEQQKQHLPTTRYDRRCLSLSPNEVNDRLKQGLPYVIRMKVPEGRIFAYNDLVLGEVKFPSADVEDQVLLKSDGFPTYHLAVVIDDHLMEITHILRGMEWLASTPKHLMLYEFFGWEPPKIGHFPLLKEVGSTKKMSKRFGDVAAAEFLKNGYLPEAVLNFVMLLGWNPGTEQEIFSLEEFVRAFSLDRVHKADMVSFDREKLLWFNGYYIRQYSAEILYSKLSDWSQKWNVDLSTELNDKTKALKILALVKDRLKTFAEFKDLVKYFFVNPNVDTALFSSFAREEWREILLKLVDKISSVTESSWRKDFLDSLAHEFCQNNDYSTKEVFMILRIAVTGQTATPPLFDVLEVLGKNAVIYRIKSVLDKNSN